MATKGTDTLDTAALQTLLGPQLAAEQAALIFQQGQEAVVFALLTLAKQLAEKQSDLTSGADPSAPSGQTPPYAKPTAKGRAKPKGAKPGHPGQRRPAPTRIDRREEHALSACPKCHGPVWPCRGSRTRIVEEYASRRARLTTRLDELIATEWEDKDAKRLIKRLRRHREDLRTFLDDPDVPFDNNHAERAIGPAVMIRKNSFGNRSDCGADTQAVLMSVYRTLQQRGHAPLKTCSRCAHDLPEKREVASATGQGHCGRLKSYE